MRLSPLLAVPLLLGTSAAPRAAPAAAPEAELLRAVNDAPALAGALHRTGAARERLGSAGRLPDPEVEGMGSRMVGPMNERGTMWELTLRHPLPRRGERAADRERARAEIALAAADYALMAGEIAADVALSLAEASGANARIELMETQLRRLEAVLRSVDARLAAGGASRIADRLTVQTRVASAQLRIEAERQMAANALTDARSRLGLGPAAPLPPYAAPAPAEIDVAEAAALQLARARRDAAAAQVKMARASANPMTAVGVRFENERRAMGDANSVGLAFMSDLPWRSRRYARAEVRAATAERAAAETDAEAARFRIAAALTRVERAERLAATARRLGADTLGRIDAEYDALLRAASAGGGGDSTVLQIVELLDKATETETQIVDADTALRTARAELWRYAPATRFASAHD